MSFFKKVKEAGSGLGQIAGSVKEQVAETGKRGKLQLEARRIQGKIDDEKNAIGHALYPMLRNGSLAVDSADVATHLSAVTTLEAELAAKKAEIEAAGASDEGDDEDADNIVDVAAVELSDTVTPGEHAARD